MEPEETVSPVDRSISVHRSILVVGGGIAGITSAVEAAEAGYEVILVEKLPYLGGRVAQLNKYFPKLCPPTCGLEINFQRLRKLMASRSIRLYTMAEVEKVHGQAGDFTVSIRQKARFVNDRCTACGDCVEVCPVDRPNDFNFGMDTTKAIYKGHPMAFPMKFAIDGGHCEGAACGKCVEACKYGAVELDMQDKSFDVHVGAVIMATGWKPYDGNKVDNLGFGRYTDVISNVMMERMASPSGPTGGKIVRPSDGQLAKTVAFVQCAGQRDRIHLPYCSGICCMASLKQATYVREQDPESKTYMFYIDLRTPGTYSFFADKVRADENVNVIKGKVARVVEDKKSGKLTVEAEHILTTEKVRVDVDLVVLATGMEASATDGETAGDINYDDDSFVVPSEAAPGIYAAGCARGPVDVATAVQDATAAAIKAMGAIQSGSRSQA